MTWGRLSVCLAIAGWLLLPVSSKAQGQEEQMRAAKEFRAYLDADWKRWMELHPEFATAVGYPGKNRRWTNHSPQGTQGILTRKAHLAEKKQGTRFAIRGFHDAVHENGALPLSLLEPRVKQWMDRPAN